GAAECAAYRRDGASGAAPQQRGCRGGWGAGVSSLGAFAFAGIALVGWIGIGWRMSRRNGKRLATARPNMGREAFIAQLTTCGTDADIAAELHDWISSYYGPEAAPHVDDHMQADVRIDPDDIEDFVTAFFERNALPMPSRKEPELLPDYREATLTTYGLYLT